MTNIVTKKDGWFVSYLPRQNDISIVMGAALGKDVPVEQDETAIVRDRTYYILNGDWRDAYAKCERWADAVEVFKANIENISVWSDKPDAN